MTKRELVHSVIQSLGYNSYVDSDGDIVINYQMKTMYVMIGKEEEQYLSVIFPHFHEIDKGEDTLVLATCNKITRDIKVAKVYIDQTFENVSASYEFFYTDEESLSHNVKKSLQILGMTRSAFYRAKQELSE